MFTVTFSKSKNIKGQIFKNLSVSEVSLITSATGGLFFIADYTDFMDFADGCQFKI
jgi:hypothetical protein